MKSRKTSKNIKSSAELQTSEKKPLATATILSKDSPLSLSSSSSTVTCRPSSIVRPNRVVVKHPETKTSNLSIVATPFHPASTGIASAVHPCPSQLSAASTSSAALSPMAVGASADHYGMLWMLNNGHALPPGFTHHSAGMPFLGAQYGPDVAPLTHYPALLPTHTSGAGMPSPAAPNSYLSSAGSPLSTLTSNSTPPSYSSDVTLTSSTPQIGPHAPRLNIGQFPVGMLRPSPPRNTYLPHSQQQALVWQQLQQAAATASVPSPAQLRMLQHPPPHPLLAHQPPAPIPGQMLIYTQHATPATTAASTSQETISPQHVSHKPLQAQPLLPVTPMVNTPKRRQTGSSACDETARSTATLVTTTAASTANAASENVSPRAGDTGGSGHRHSPRIQVYFIGDHQHNAKSQPSIDDIYPDFIPRKQSVIQVTPTFTLTTPTPSIVTAVTNAESISSLTTTNSNSNSKRQNIQLFFNIDNSGQVEALSSPSPSPIPVESCSVSTQTDPPDLVKGSTKKQCAEDDKPEKWFYLSWSKYCSVQPYENGCSFRLVTLTGDMFDQSKTYMEHVRQLVMGVKCILVDLERCSQCKISEYCIRLMAVNKRKGCKFRSLNPKTWNTSDLHEFHQVHCVSTGLDGLVCLASVTDQSLPLNLVHDWYDEHYYACLLQQALVNYFILQEPDHRLGYHPIAAHAPTSKTTNAFTASSNNTILDGEHVNCGSTPLGKVTTVAAYVLCLTFRYHRAAGDDLALPPQSAEESPLLAKIRGNARNTPSPNTTLEKERISPTHDRVISPASEGEDAISLDTTSL